jgi:hypothetical protein
MLFSIVSRVGYDADVTHSRSERKRPSKRPPQDKSADFVSADAQVLEMDASDEEETVSTAGLSILAQALAAYSQN